MPDRAASPPDRADDARLGIAFILFGMLCISVNDMLMKALADGYPLHQLVLMRSTVALAINLAILRAEGGWRALRTATPGLHLLRGLLIVVANMTFFLALAAIPLADATALFFVAPLLITLLSIPFLGERVGPRRLAACATGFLGVLVMLRPGGEMPGGAERWVLAMPLVAAVAYAGMQILTRRLGVSSKPSAMAIYIQATFIAVSLGFGLVAGDGRFAEGLESGSLIFLLRAWTWPGAADWGLIALLGTVSGGIGYALSRAYSSAAAATVAPFEYVSLPLAMLWGWVVFGDVPGGAVLLGTALIAGSGIYVFAREARLGRRVASRRPTRRA